MLNYQSARISRRVDNGITFLTLYTDDWVGPRGMVWGIAHARNDGGKTVFNVFGSYVPQSSRRQGVRTEINRALLKEFDLITTASGTKEGAAFMRAAGYKLNDAGQWMLDKLKVKNGAR